MGGAKSLSGEGGLTARIQFFGGNTYQSNAIGLRKHGFNFIILTKMI